MWCPQSIRGDNPLLTAKNCILTPHISWAPRESRQRIMDCTVDNVRAYLQAPHSTWSTRDRTGAGLSARPAHPERRKLMSKWILMPDSFKGTMSSLEICQLMREALLRHVRMQRWSPFPWRMAARGAWRRFWPPWAATG
mgnify:CR=1 FL=1